MASGFSLIGMVLSAVYIALAIAVAIYGNRLFKSLPVGLWGDIGVSVIAIAAFAVFMGDGSYRLLIELNDDYPRYFALAYMPIVAFVAIGFVRSLVPLILARVFQAAPAMAMAGPDSGSPIPGAPLPGAAISSPPSLGGSGPGVPPPGSGPADPGQKPPSTLKKKVQAGVGIAVLVLIALIYLARFMTRNDLPGCSATTTKDVLSDIFKSKKVEVKRYDDIKTNSTSDSEITCTAFMTMMNDHKAEIDYSVHFDDQKRVEVRITAGRDK